MKHFFTKFMMMAVLAMSTLSVNAQQLPDPGFEDWSGTKFDGEIQPKYWNYSNVEQLGINFNFAHKSNGRSGSCAYIENQFCGKLGIGQTSPGYLTLGKAWQYISSMTAINEATGGTDGGLNFRYRPDSISVWIKRTGSSAASEEYSVLFYSWKGTSKGTSYKANKSDGCTNVGETHENEESDIRQMMDANKCQTTQKATQIAEGFWFEKKAYGDWTQIKVPIYYMNDDQPEMCNVIFSSSGYPNFRQSGNINEGSGLYVDDVELIYSAKIQHLYIGGKRWDGFDPNSTEEQVYSVGQSNDVPEIYAVRGAGTLKNLRGDQVVVNGRKLSGDEISINYGKVDGDPTVITVKSGDGKSTTTYKIKMTKAASTNATLNSILVNGELITGYNPQVTTYNVALPYGTTAAPVVSVIQAEDKQTVAITQATSPTGKATIVVTAADGKNKKTYTINFSIAPLADNTLKGIKVNGEEIMDFSPSMTSYNVELPIGTTKMPTIEAVSAYPAGAQTIQYTAPDKIDGGVYKISVTTPGNQTPKVYKLTFVLTASTNSKLKDLQMEGYDLGFSPSKTTYHVTLAMGTTELPKITWVPGDAYQTIVPSYGGVDGTTTITVTAASGAQTKYNIVCKTEKSEESRLNMIYINGTPLEGFNPDVTNYTYALTPGTTELPTITYDKRDPYEDVTIAYGGLNGTTRITVVAGNGNTTIYKITFSVELDANVTLKAIYLDGKLLDGFDENVFTYQITLPRGTEQLPVITWTKSDESQTVTPRYNGVNGDTKLTVRAQSGASAEYTLQFRVYKDTINHLDMIYLDGKPLEGFHKDTLRYIDSLPVGVSKIPAITYTLGAASATAKVLNQGNQRTIRVTAESGAVRDYVIMFVIRKSESAFPKMIFVDGQPLAGFDPKVMEYTYMFDGDVAPEITAEKDGDQQVIILTPYRDGDATVTVLPAGGGSGNTYIIHLVLKPKTAVQLQAIMAGGTLLEGYQPDLLAYSVDYYGEMPEVTFVSSADQVVDVFQSNNVVRLVVSSDGEQAVYVITFNRLLSDDASLAGIQLDGVALAGFDPDSLNYVIQLQAGSAIPEITYTLNHPEQVAILGQTGDKLFAIQVLAEDGTTSATYSLDFNVIRSAAELESLRLNGTIITLEEGVYSYTQTIDAGDELPVLGFTPTDGQTILAVNTSDTTQQIIVKSDDGHVSVYTIDYDPIYSSDAQLIAIELDGTPMENFDRDTYNYTDTLPWRSQVVPNIHPIGATPNQIIEIHYGAVDAKTHIHVTAADKVTTADYYIDFPVVKSANVALQSVAFDDVDFDFAPETTDYTITLPYQTQAVPVIHYKAAEPEQQIKFVNAPISDTTRLVVTAENGDIREYKFAFKVTPSPKPNALDSIFYTYETKVTAEPVRVSRKVTEGESDIAISLPYATTSFTVDYMKNYDEQTVLVQPGGIYNPTVITVKSNRDDEEDKVYTITPDIEQQDPAVLESISINGTPLAGFDKNRFSYIVNLSAESPYITFTTPDPYVMVSPTQTAEEWKATVRKDGIENTYTIHFFFPADVIPNGEFTSWGKTKVSKTHNWFGSNDYTDKPNSWNAPGDYIDQYLGTAEAGPAVQKESGSIVHLKTTYWAALAGPVPAVINLATMSASFAVAGGTRVVPAGSIPFRNTPDQAIINYKYTSKAGNGALFRFKFVDPFGNETPFDLSKTSTGSNYVTETLNLNTDGINVTGLDIIIDASGEYPNGSSGADLYVDYIRFTYSSALDKVEVEGVEATLEGNKFSSTLSSEFIGVPALKFIGKVSDQAQLVDWKNGGAEVNRVRKATITNYAEDGTFTQYELEITRPASKVNTLAALEVNGIPQDLSDPEVTEFTIPVPFGTKRLYDVRAQHGSNYQTVVTEQNGNVVTVTVTPEEGEAKTYKVIFQEQKSNDVTLEDLIATGVTYDPEITEYNLTADALPEIKFVKKSDGQTVTLNNGVLTILAEDGETTGTIIIANTLPETSGMLEDLTLDGITIEGFEADTYRYNHAEPQTTAFVREFARDTVLQTITPDSVIWQVTGTEQHTYSLVYPTSLSDVALLSAILVNGEMVDDFVPADPEYTIYLSDSVFNAPVRIDVLPAAGQKITVSVDVQPIAAAPARRVQAEQVGLLFTLAVTAEDGEHTMTYYLSVLPKKSADASLKMLRLDGEDLDGFAADQTRYVVTLPCANPKLVEPKAPSVTYLANQYAQIIEQEVRQENDTTYNIITVTSEDGLNKRIYELLVTTERSRNADITALMLDGKMLENFSPERTYYSALVKDLDVEVAYSAVDRFLTIDTLIRNSVLTLHVVAQDTTVHKDYVIELYTQSLSTDASLADILLNGMSFTEYDPELIPFNPMNSYYSIPMASNQVKPEVSARLSHPGQTMDIDVSRQDSVLITVRAEDGVHSNVYVLYFKVERSSNTALAKLEVGDTPLALVPGTFDYTFALPVGEKQPREVTFELQDYDLQSYENEQTEGMTWSVDVIAENGARVTYTVTFVLTLSQNALLSDITVDDQSLEGFDPEVNKYVITLPQGNRRVPGLRFYEGDQWQREQVIDTIATKLRTTYQCHVLAEDSIHRNTYEVEVNILPSDVDTLISINVNNRLLEGFSPRVSNYAYKLPAGTTELPTVEIEPGDEFQTIDSVSTGVNGVMSILVTAENGSQRRYAIQFEVERSAIATLDSIFCGGNLLEDFDPETYEYTITLPYGTTNIPVVTYNQHEPEQQTVMTVEGDKVIITVTAADGSQQTYTLTFLYAKSSDAHLASISIDDEPLEGFDPNTSDYTILLPYGTTEIPVVTATLADSTATMEIVAEGQTVAISTLAADGRTPYEYTVTFIIEGCPINYLNDIMVNGVTIDGFTPDSIYYIIAYPAGSDSTVFVTADAVTYEVADPTEEVNVSTEGSWVFVTVMSQSGVSRVYMIEQVIRLSDNSLLADLTLNGTTIANFDDSVFVYEYLLLDGQSTPMVEAVPQDSLAKVTVTPGAVGEPTFIYCTAEDGSETVYTVLFSVSSINTSLDARSTDVLFKQIPGSDQFAAYSIRVNTNIAIYDHMGKKYYDAPLPVCDPNDVTIAHDPSGREILTDATGNGVYITLPVHGHTFFYLFYSGKERIASGKFMVQ